MSLELAILVSGTGSNMKAILEAIDQKRLSARVSVVLSNNADAPALETAGKFSVPTAAVPHAGLTRQQHEEAVIAELGKYKFDFIVLAGYMRVLTPEFLRHFKHKDGYFKVINIHPSLLPAFPGAHGYEDAFNYGVRLHGVTIHLVDEAVDHGPILAQASFERKPDDTLDVFRARGLALEHKLYPAVLQDIAANGIQLIAGSRDKPVAAAKSSGGGGA